jgi:hypothetical protein
LAEPPEDRSLLDDDQMDELAVLLHEFITTPTFHGKQRLVEDNPVLLLSDEADAALAGLLLAYGDDADLSEALTFHRALLRRSRQIGVTEAFVETRRKLEQAPSGDGNLSAEQAEALVDVIGEFITADDWETSYALLSEHPELLSPEADAVFERLIQTHTAREQRNVVRQLIIHRDLLRACQDIGVEAAFARMMDPPDVLDILAENTIAVLTRQPEDRETWAEAVRQSRIRAAELGQDDMLALLKAISRLLDGLMPGDIEPPPEGPHAACWRRIVEAVPPGGGVLPA